MKLIIDAQMPFRLSQLLKEKGHDVIHTDDLVNKERTSDSEIRNIAQQEKRIVVTKDVDFLNSFYINKSPYADVYFLIAPSFRTGEKATYKHRL